MIPLLCRAFIILRVANKQQLKIGERQPQKKLSNPNKRAGCASRGALRDLVPKVTLLHGCFSRF